MLLNSPQKFTPSRLPNCCRNAWWSALGFFAPADGGNLSPQRWHHLCRRRAPRRRSLIAAVGDDDVQYAIVGDTFQREPAFPTTMRNAHSLFSRRYRASGCLHKDMKLRDEAEAFHTHHA